MGQCASVGAKPERKRVNPTLSASLPPGGKLHAAPGSAVGLGINRVFPAAAKLEGEAELDGGEAIEARGAAASTVQNTKQKTT